MEDNVPTVPAEKMETNIWENDIIFCLIAALMYDCLITSSQEWKLLNNSINILNKV
jgi:hypothetical protein